MMTGFILKRLRVVTHHETRKSTWTQFSLSSEDLRMVASLKLSRPKSEASTMGTQRSYTLDFCSPVILKVAQCTGRASVISFSPHFWRRQRIW